MGGGRGGGSSLFGSSKGHSTNRPLFKSTGYSFIRGKRFDLDPSVRNIQNEALQNYASLYGDVGQATDRYLTQSQGLRDYYTGNRGAFIEAQAAPVRERFASLRGEAQQGLGRRGLGGSSFGINALRDIDTEAGIQEGRARALATQQLAEFEAGLNAQELTALNNSIEQRMRLTGESREVARQRALTELAIFGLGSRTDQVIRQQQHKIWGEGGSAGFTGGGGGSN